MSFSTMRPWLAGGAMIVAVAGAAQAQEDPKAAFEARYVELRDAMMGNNKAAAERLLAADYEIIDIRGETRGRAEVMERMGQMPPGMENVKPESKVLKVTVKGDTANVESQMTMQMKRPDENGEEMLLDIAVISDDVWVQRGGAWVLQRSTQKELTVSRNGEVVFRQAN
ncbi:MAG TPA: nuclear transport factor 2 family protein [Novosphingobium sp.]|nr:nuclear transport factor 2 family protein [Novosphingobium sp.]